MENLDTTAEQAVDTQTFGIAPEADPALRTDKGSAADPLTDADAAADLAGTPRPGSAVDSDAAEHQALQELALGSIGDVSAINLPAAHTATAAAAEPAPEPRLVIAPSVGRKVWFFPNGCQTLHSQPKCIDAAQGMDASITFPWSDEMVNLHVVDHIGQVHAFNSVVLVQPSDDCPPLGTPYAVWMPFQVGQARASV